MMVKALEQAIAEVANLPAATQEKIGRELLLHLEKLRKLRSAINGSIDRGGSYTDEEVEASIATRLDAWERNTAR